MINLRFLAVDKTPCNLVWSCIMMIDRTGQVFGRWTVVSFSHKKKHPNPKFRLVHIYWNCRCLCGTESIVRGRELVRGKTLSCGCLARELRSLRARHGHNRTTGTRESRTHASWRSMKD